MKFKKKKLKWCRGFLFSSYKLEMIHADEKALESHKFCSPKSGLYCQMLATLPFYLHLLKVEEGKNR